jgi:flagellin-like protein
MRGKKMVYNKKGESGIGTLIIFIAMLLVAAIAAGVLIQTVGSLQNKALTTGQQSKSQISTHLEVVNMVGQDGTNGVIDNVSLVIKLAAGSESIQFDELIITVDTTSDFATLSYEPVIANLAQGNYVVTPLQNGTNHKDGYLVRGDVAKLDVMLPSSLSESEQVRFDMIPKVGIPTALEVSMPDIMTSLRVHLYP